MPDKHYRATERNEFINILKFCLCWIIYDPSSNDKTASEVISCTNVIEKQPNAVCRRRGSR